jgi:Anti-sigma-K factor rskA
MGKPRMGARGEELPTRLAENPTPPAGARPSPNRWYRRVSFWRSVAGMAVAIALGCAAVASEIASELSSRTTFFHHRLQLLRSRISELRSEANDAERHLAAMHAEPAAGADTTRVLSAADVVVLRLRPSPASKAAGMAAISRRVGGAIIEISGLPAIVGQTYVAWWLLARGAPSKAAIFTPRADGSLSRAIEMPPPGASVAGAIVTLESQNAARQPDGKIILKGELPRPQVLR